jgi:hypothetical protein
VQLAGSASWQFAESDRDDLPHVALFIRDAVALPVPPGPLVPPPLTGDVPDLRGLHSPQDRQEAGLQWVDWWASVIGSVLAEHQAVPGPDLDTTWQALAARRERAGSPPDFAALADRPALHRVVAETFPEAHRWVSRLGFEHREQPHGRFAYRLVRQVAEDVAFDRSVNVGDMRASAIVLEVEGSWWHLLAPGTVLCSKAAAAEPSTAQLVLRRAFESGPNR